VQSRLTVKSAEADRDFVAVWPIPSEEARSADRTKRFGCAVNWTERANQALALKEAEAVTGRYPTWVSPKVPECLRQREQWQ
jgi:hypothetical protein